MAGKGMGPLLLLGGAAALMLATRKKDKAPAVEEGIVAQGSRVNNLNIPMHYRVKTAAGIPGFAMGEGAIAYIPEIATARDFEQGTWIQLAPQESLEEAEDVALTKLADEGFDREL